MAAVPSGPNKTSVDEVLRPSTTGSLRRKALISPTSSFVDFGTLETEYFTAERTAAGEFYNPYHHRTLKKPITNFECVIHMLKGSIGGGVLAMPIAFTHVGVLPGIILTVFLTVVCIYGMDTLLRMQYIQCKRLQSPFIPLPTSMRIGFKNGPACLRCFAPIAPLLVDFFLVSFQLGACSAYVIFFATAVQRVVERSFNEKIDLNWYLLMIFVPVCLLNFIRDLKKLMPLSMLANLLIMFSFSCCFYYILFVGEWKTDTVEVVAPVNEWPLFIGTVLFSLEAAGVIITLEHNMETPEDFLGKKGILPWCLTVVACLYMVIGLLGYLKYGEDTKETIFQSLPEYEWLSLTIYAIYGVCIFLTYPLQCFVPLEILWGNYIRHLITDPMKECFVEYVLRTITVIVTFLGAVLIPHFDTVISLVGAFCISFLGIILPFTLELCTKWPKQLGCYYWIVFKTLFLIILGFSTLILGTYVSLYSFIAANDKK